MAWRQGRLRARHDRRGRGQHTSRPRASCRLPVAECFAQGRSPVLATGDAGALPHAFGDPPAACCRVQEALWAYSISAFVAHNDIEPTQEWQTEIETALATCHALVAMLRAGFHGSNWTDQEVGFAMGRGVPVFSVRFGEIPMASSGGSRRSTAQARLPQPSLVSFLGCIVRTNKRRV